MALEAFSGDVEVIQKLSTYPNQEEGLTAEDVKAKFDEASKALKEYLNGQVVPAVRDLQENAENADKAISNAEGKIKKLSENAKVTGEAIGDRQSVAQGVYDTLAIESEVAESVILHNSSTRFREDGTSYTGENWEVSDFVEIGIGCTVTGFALLGVPYAVTYDAEYNIKNVYLSEGHQVYTTQNLTIEDGVYVRVASCSGLNKPGAIVKKYIPQYLMTTKKQYTEGYIYFTVNVDTNVPDCDITTDSTQDNTNKKDFWCVLKLPTTYSPVGTPTKLAVCMHGAGGVVYDGHAGELVGYSVLCDAENYAVLDCNGVDGVTTEAGSAEHMGNPVALRAYKKAIDYVVENYNVESMVYLHGHSMGGLCALNFTNMFPNIVKVLGLHYPVTDLYNQAWLNPWYPAQTKKSIATLYKFDDTSGATYEADKLAGYNPIANRTVTIDGEAYTNLPVPIKIWHGLADTAVNYQSSVNLVNAIKRNGGIAYLRLLDGVGHNQGSGAMVTELRRWFNRF